MRSTIIASVAALAAGLILGLIAGNTIAVVLLRSLLTAALVGGGVFGIGFLVKKFLPELSSGTVPTSDLSDMAEQSDTGNRVDIVVSDDESDDFADTDAPARSRSGKRRDNDNMFAQETGLEAIVEEVAEEGIADSDSSSDEDSGFSEDAFYAGVENLPDISGFESSFGRGVSESDSGQEDEFDSGDSPPRSSSRSSGGSAEGTDPKILARAISTALKKG